MSKHFPFCTNLAIWRENGGERLENSGGRKQILAEENNWGGEVVRQVHWFAHTGWYLMVDLPRHQQWAGVVGATFAEVHSRIFHPVLQIDNGRPEDGEIAFNHAISSTGEITWHCCFKTQFLLNWA